MNIGSRQSGRECGDNVLHVGYDAKEIEQAIQNQITHGAYNPSPIFGDGNAGEKIAEILATTVFKIQKRLSY